MGMVQSTYTSHENGTRDFDEYDAVRYARRFKVSKEWLLFGTTESDAEIPPDALPVLGEVRAGAWLEMDGEQSPSEYLPLTSDPMYRRARQYALRVVGTSMNKIIDPGAFVIVADWSDLGKMPEQDELVIVKRQRGSTVECTVKRAKRTDDGWELWPESTDPRWQEPIRLVDGGLDDEVQIIGKVIGKYDRLI